MAALIPLATPEDYEERYGRPEGADAERLPALLSDASAIILGRMGGAWVEGADPAFDAVARAVACAMAGRCLRRPMGMDGVTQYTQTAGAYSVNLSLSGQDMRIFPSELEALGLTDCTVRCARMGAGRGGDEGQV